MIALAWLGIAILIGIYAQRGRGRTGVAWGFVTAVLYPVVWLLVETAVRSDPQLLRNPYTTRSVDITAALVTGAIMAALVWTLPRRQRNLPATAATPNQPSARQDPQI